MKIKTSVLLCIIAIFPITLFAAEFPNFCRVSGLRFSKASVLLFSQHTSKPRMYVIQNISHSPIWLNHEKKNPSASAGWSSRLFPDHWSAILVTDRNFDLQCQFQKKSGAMRAMPCKQMIRVCQFSEFYSKNPLSGGYWVVENVPFRALLSRIDARGFSLPDPGQPHYNLAAPRIS
ncbi:MAG: hypothetical protein A3F13_03715 [Gammaproteobacteria bacterium RIFCSPHIGHO2_12_FULL_40_19]|nr:MAG: hypothetical protein A3F13_03715 [Gammaproteobacteria bacterium RIFCSPHIGHO2_12_FULL_40_19]